VDKVLALLCPDLSRSVIKRAIGEGLASLDGEQVKASKMVLAGQKLDFYPPPPRENQTLSSNDFRLDVIYEDEELLVINKPSSLAVHPNDGQHRLTLVDYLIALRPELSQVGPPARHAIVHRLDKDTSGVLVTAKTNRSHALLQASFAARKVDKYYLAFVHGLAPVSGLINSPIGRHPVHRYKMKAGLSGGRESQTAFRLLKQFSSIGVSLIHIKLLTGRTHQARVHLASIGFPILADGLYGRNRHALFEAHPELKPLLRRQCLHARRLAIDHPNGERMTFRAPWPDDLLDLFKTLLEIQTNN
jgi:23S rRNA pseudouridine1911/1915/1917 synthase